MTKRALRLRPVTSNKEVLDSTQVGVTASTNTDVILATAVQNYDGTQFECPVGARISAIYLFVQIVTGFSGNNVDWYFAKRRAGQIESTDYPNPGATGGDPLRNTILHEEKGIPGDGDNVSPLTFRGVIRIPRNVQRMREGDRIFLKLRGSVNSYDLCVKAIYKWFI